MNQYKPKLWSPSYINVCLANFLMACSFNLLMPSIPLYITEVMGVEQSRTGIVLASYAIALLVVRPFSGYIVDIFPRKKVLLVAFTCYVLIFFGYFLATTILIFILVRFIHGLTWGLSTVSSSTLAIDVVPSERRAEGIGYYGTCMNVAMAIAPFFALHIYEHYGFEKLLWCAIFMGMLGIFTVALIKAPQKPKVESEKLSFDRFFLFKGWPIFINQLLPCFGWGTIGPFVAQYGKQINIPNAGIFFLFWAGGLVASRVFSGKMVDRGNIHLVNIIGMSLAALSFLIFATIHNIYAFCGAGLFIGIGFGMMAPALQTLYINMAPNNQRGTANSTYLLGFDLGLAFGMLVGGYISGNSSFETLFLVSSLLCVVSIIYYYFWSRKVFEKKRLR